MGGDWYGVVAVDGRVVEIALPHNGLDGYLPHETSALTSLTRLDLRWNEISGGIPQEYGEMSALQTLLLTDNRLTGHLPRTLGDLSALQRLDLSYNAFTGTIPAELGKLSAMESLGLHNNRLTGEIPQELSGAYNLRRLVLNDNRLVGALPGGFARIRDLDHIHIVGNDIPNAFDGGPSNKGLDFKDDNAITGAQVLDRTTQVIGDTETEEFMRAVLRSLELHSGLVHVNTSSLPPGVNANAVQAVVDDFNRKLMEREEWVFSLLDFERAFELYGRGGLQVPDAEARGMDNESSTAAINGSKTSTGRYSPQDRSPHTQSVASAQITCPVMQPNYPHASGHNPGFIVGNGHGNCVYDFGPPQVLSYELWSYLQEKRGWWIFTYWAQVGTLGSAPKSGLNLNPSWKQRELVAATPCTTGTFRTRLAMYIRGSVSGVFVPHPGLYASPARRVSC